MTTKSPRVVLSGEASCTIFAFPPNREALGGTAYLIVENQNNILVDCPFWDEANQQFLQAQGGVKWLVLTHRGAIAKAKEIQAALGCDIVIQEQEAYLLPGATVTAFRQEFSLHPNCRVLWTPGHSPGSACVYHAAYGGVLFSGRHLLPNQQGNPVPLRTSKTFHWPRQIRSVQTILDQFTPDTLSHICPGANTGFLRGQRSIDAAYDRLVELDLQTLLQSPPGL